MFSPGNEPWPSWPGQAWTKGSGRWAHTPNMSLGITCISACIAIRFSAYYGNRVNRYICIYTHIYIYVCVWIWILFIPWIHGACIYAEIMRISSKLCVYNHLYIYIYIWVRIDIAASLPNISQHIRQGTIPKSMILTRGALVVFAPDRRVDSWFWAALRMVDIPKWQLWMGNIWKNMEKLMITTWLFNIAMENHHF